MGARLTAGDGCLSANDSRHREPSRGRIDVRDGPVLSSGLGEETYCVSIDVVTEIVDEQAAAGWLVDEVHQVVDVDAEGVVIWVDPRARTEGRSVGVARYRATNL